MTMGINCYFLFLSSLFKWKYMLESGPILVIVWLQSAIRPVEPDCKNRTEIVQTVLSRNVVVWQLKERFHVKTPELRYQIALVSTND